MILAYASKLGFQVCQTNVKAQKINGFILKTFEIVTTNFQIEDKLKIVRFYRNIFLLVNISVEVVIKIYLLNLSNTNMLFSK